MFKFLVRRIRYAMAGKAMKLTRALIGALCLAALAFFVFGGFFSQKKVLKGFTKFVLDTSKEQSEKIENGDVPITVTDEGVYLKGHEVGNEIGGSSNDEANDESSEQEENTKENTEENTGEK